MQKNVIVLVYRNFQLHLNELLLQASICLYINLGIILLMESSVVDKNFCLTFS